MKTVAPYGSWDSPITLDVLYAGRVTPAEPRFDGDEILWLESRPDEAGRDVVVGRGPDGTIADAVPADANVRTMAHEYGGAAWTAHRGVVYYSDRVDGRVYRIERGGAPRPLTPPGAFRYADLAIDPDRARLLAIREDHSADPSEASNTIVAIATDPPGEPGEPIVLAIGRDFYAAPRLAPDGRHLAWLAWDHPNMPWDGTELWWADIDAAGTLRAPRLAAGGRDLWVAQPRWSPQGKLYAVAESSGWMNLYRVGAGVLEPILPAEAEFATPDWVFGRSSYAFLEDGTIVAAARSEGRDRLWRIPRQGPAEAVDLPFTEMDGLAAQGTRAAFVGSGPTDVGGLVLLDMGDGSWSYLRRMVQIDLDPAEFSVGHPITFRTTDGALAHGIFYPPRNPRQSALPGERPPLIVTSHGGPTAAAPTSVRLSLQYFTSRGLAVVDVDYRGSTGYGRAYRRALEDHWGVYDVDDCVAAARHLADEGLVDGDRVAIRGGSASGYTTLCALTFRDDFRAGVSYFGIGDLETFARDTHKFESRYLDRLVGRYPEAKARYVERSPIHFLDRLSCPLLILQGLDDRVVPPNQAEDMVRALRANGLPYAYLPFEGEGHGFRRIENLRRATEAELAFYGRVFGFTPADALPPLQLEGAA